MELDRFLRAKTLFGEDFSKIQNAKILVLGCGGVGGYAIDALYRSGARNLSVVDFDKFEITNQNRQIGSENLGLSKALFFEQNYPGIKGIDLELNPYNLDNLDLDNFDLIIDAIDDMKVKVALAQKAHKKLISSCGSAKKTDPRKIEISSIWKTHGDPLAKKFRYELKKVGFNKKFDVVFSSEEAKCKDLGSFVGITGSFGLFLASLAIEKILAK